MNFFTDKTCSSFIVPYPSFLDSVIADSIYTSEICLLYMKLHAQNPTSMHAIINKSAVDIHETPVI